MTVIQIVLYYEQSTSQFALFNAFVQQMTFFNIFLLDFCSVQ